MDRYAGGCHCGNIRYIYQCDAEPAAWSVRRCTCSYCLRFAARYTSAAGARLEITVLYASMLQRYEFGTRTAEFIRCSRCGVMVAALCEAPTCIAVLNVNTLDAIESYVLNVKQADFEGEDTGDRMARRRANWIQDVSVEYINA